MRAHERRSRRRLVWSGTVAAAVVASALTIPTSGAGLRHREPGRDQRGDEGVARRPAPGPARHSAAHPQRPGDQEPDLPRRRGRPQRPGPDHRGRAHPGRGVRRERAPAARPPADEGAAPHPRARCRRRATRWPTAATGSPAGRSSSSRPTLGVYLLYDKQRRSSSPVGPRRGRPARRPSGRAARSATGSPSPTPGSGCGSRAPSGSRCGSPRAAPATPRPTSTSTGRRSRASRRTRRCAGTSTGTPTGWPSSSSAAGCTAAGRGTSTARRTHCGTAPTTRSPRATARSSRRSSPAQPSHDPVGWPTFKDWPAPDSLTHEGTYYRWLERAWRGGQRLFVNLLVENNKLCQVYPLKRNSCDDMDSIRLQAKDMYQIQDYIDAQAGGPGKGFYRIVTDPFEARRVINAGKLAVVMGIETSVPFGCTIKLDRPAVQRQGDRPAARRGAPARRPPDGAGQQVRQRALRRRRRPGRGRGRRQRRQLPRDRVVLGHAALRARRRREPRQQPGRAARHRRRAAGRAVRRDRAALRRARRAPCSRSTRRPTTATAAA